MNMAGALAQDFAGARPVANHCAELTRTAGRQAERGEHLAAWRRELETALAQELSVLFSAGKLQVALSEPEIIAGREIFERIGPVAVNSLLRCGASDETALLSVDYATAIALTDCSFGGVGALPEDIPAQLPRSAGMLVEEFATIIARTIVLARDPAATGCGDVLVRSESVTRLKPFAAEADAAFFRLSLSQDEDRQWQAILAIADERLEDFLPGMGSSPNAVVRSGQVSNGTNGAFAAMPLPVEAVLSEFEMSLDRLETLAPGDEIPLAIPRQLPLRMGENIFAFGALGTLDNRMALRLTQLPDLAGTQQSTGEHIEFQTHDRADSHGGLA